MPCKVLLFGYLAEKSGVKEIIIHREDKIPDCRGTIEHLVKKYPELGKLTFKVAVNQILINGNAPVKDGDEIALMPPYAGG